MSRRKGATEVADRRNGSLGWETSNRSLPEQPCSSSTMSLVEGVIMVSNVLHNLLILSGIPFS